MSKSADFKGRKDLLLDIVMAFGEAKRSNETFWKVFSSHITDVVDDLTFDSFVQVLDVLDYHSGEPMFQVFVQKFFIDE